MGKEENTAPIVHKVEIGEKSSETMVRNKSTDRASLHGNTVGFVAEEEMPEQFIDKFKVKTDKAVETKSKYKVSQKAENIPTEEGFQPVYSEAASQEKLSHRTETAQLTKVPGVRMEKAVCEVSSQGAPMEPAEMAAYIPDKIDEE